MTSNDLLLLGVKSRVLAISKTDGHTVWSTQLPGGMGTTFVTVLADGQRIYAHARGQVHCLNLLSGDLLWSNDLPGCGYGFASLALANGATAPDPAVAAALIAAQQAAANAASSSPGVH